MFGFMQKSEKTKEKEKAIQNLTDLGFKRDDVIKVLNEYPNVDVAADILFGM